MKKKVINLILLVIMLMNATVVMAQPEFVVTSSVSEYNSDYKMQKTFVSVKNVGDTPGRVTVKGFSEGVEGDSISKNIKVGEVAEFGLLTPSNTDLKVFHNDIELPQENWDIAEAFKVVSTTAKDGYSPQQELYFEFNRPINESSIENVIFYENGQQRSFVYEYEDNRLAIRKSAGIFNYDSSYKIDLTSIEDFFGEKLLQNQYVFSTAKIDSEFAVYQKASVVTQVGIGGAAVLVMLKGDSKICFTRTTVGLQSSGLPFVPSCYAKIIDPLGNLVKIHDLTDASTGTTTIVDDIKYMEGIWTIQFISGNVGDILGIGLSDAKSWGIRGETVLGVTDTTPVDSYVYVPDKVNSFVAASEKGKGLKIYDSNDNLVATSSTVNYTSAKTGCIINNISSGNVYKVSLDNGFYGGLIIDRIPSLMCPTAEMAKELKGGWRNVEGIICQGSIQESARREALRLLSEKNLDVSAKDRPSSPPDVEDPVAESLMFGSYGLISPLGDQLKRQILDPDSPYLGRILTTEQYNNGEIITSWETGNFNAWGEETFGALISTNAELNYFYENEALINRSAISILGSLAALSEDFIIREGNNAANSPMKHGNFYFSYIAKCYAYIRDYLDAQTRTVIDNGLTALCDKQGNFRGYQTNQWMFTVSGIEAVYRSTMEKRHLNSAKRHIQGLSKGVYAEKFGQSDAGYYIENGGCDGSYNNLGESLIYTMYKEHKNCSSPDTQMLTMLYDSIVKSVEFDSLFWLPQPQLVGCIGPNCFTTRTDSSFAWIDHINYPVLIDEFPLAKRRFEIQNTPITGVDGASTFPYYINNEVWANRLIKSQWPSYELKYKGYESNGNPEWYKAIKNREMCKSELLPCEQDSGIWEKPGIVAIKHKGLYFNVFYTFNELTTMPEMSFMGGGLTTVWSEPTGVVLASRKHKNYEEITSDDDLMATCVYGKNEDGELVFNGKEKASLEWVEEGKIFKITEQITNSNATVTWQYTLAENNIEMKVSISGNLNDVWLNIPILKSEAEAINKYDSKAVYQEYNGQEVAFSTDNECKISESGNTTRFRVKLNNQGTAIVNISAQNSQGLQITEKSTEHVTILNGASDKKYINVYYVEYDEANCLKNCSVNRIEILPHTYVNVNKINGKCMFIWDDNMCPIAESF